MAIKPQVSNFRANSVQVLNAIRNSASTVYKDYVPVADDTLDSIRAIGNVIMDYPSLTNEFLSALVNRIGRVIVSSKMYSNPWSMFKMGELELGEAIEEVFVNIAKPFEYDPAIAETNLFKREIPDVRAAFHILNYKKFYKQTIQNESLRQAFLSWDGITDLIAKITSAMYSAANYDEFVTMKYLIARMILDGQMNTVTIPTVSAENAKQIGSIIKGTSNALTFMTNKYNLAGVSTYTDKGDQYLIATSEFDAVNDVEVLAAAFNMSKAEFEGHRILVDSFGEFDDERLDLLFGDDPNYTAITPEEKTELKKIPAVLIDKGWFVIIDNMFKFTEAYNGEGLYWNYFLHVWKTFSTSPFHNNVLFVTGTPSINTVTVSPSAVTMFKGQTLLLSATVDTENFASQAVTWSSDKAEQGVTVNRRGEVTVAEDCEETTATITATSVYDAQKTSNCVITIQSVD